MLQRWIGKAYRIEDLPEALACMLVLLARKIPTLSLIYAPYLKTLTDVIVLSTRLDPVI